MKLILERAQDGRKGLTKVWCISHQSTLLVDLSGPVDGLFRNLVSSFRKWNKDYVLLGSVIGQQQSHRHAPNRVAKGTALSF